MMNQHNQLKDEEPYLAVHPWVGLMIFLVFGAAFAFLTLQVVDKGPLTRWDMPYALALHNWAIHQPPIIVLPLKGFSVIGREGIALVCIVLFVRWLIRKEERKQGMVLLGVIGGEMWFEIISNIVVRQRPEFRTFETLLGPGYPSGHMTTAVLLTWLILYLAWRRLTLARKILYTTLLVLLCVGIGFSRLFLGVHYLTDIAGGIFLGLAWGGLIYTAIDLYFYRVRVASRQPAAFGK